MTTLRQELREQGLLLKKRLGQHFLVDRNIIDKVIRAAAVKRDDVILEVGPGLGGMTRELARLAQKVVAVEIDPRLVEILRKKMAFVSNVEIIQEDILRIDFDALSRYVKSPFKVVANLPYQISTPLLFRFIESRNLFSSLTLMLQREVVERMIAPPGGKEYGALSVLVQAVSNPKVQFIVKPSVFFPPPEVESAVVHLAWKDKPLAGFASEAWFRKVVKASFGYRRKTLLNALKRSKLVSPDFMESRMNAIGIDPKRRPETLTLQEFLRLADALR